MAPRLPRFLRLSLALAVLLGSSSCISWYESIERNDDGTYVLIRNERKGLLFGGPKAQLWVGRYDPSRKTMTITRKSEKGV